LNLWIGIFVTDFLHYWFLIETIYFIHNIFKIQRFIFILLFVFLLLPFIFINCEELRLIQKDKYQNFKLTHHCSFLLLSESFLELFLFRIWHYHLFFCLFFWKGKGICSLEKVRFWWDDQENECSFGDRV
jgi:hypothetical protein